MVVPKVYLHNFLADPRWFSASGKNWGYPKFLLLNRLNDPANGYKLKDIVIIEAEIKVMAVEKNFWEKISGFLIFFVHTPSWYTLAKICDPKFRIV